jgi:hypothetical protein
MKRKRFTEEQITYALSQAEAGITASRRILAAASCPYFTNVILFVST